MDPYLLQRQALLGQLKSIIDPLGQGRALLQLVEFEHFEISKAFEFLRCRPEPVVKHVKHFLFLGWDHGQIIAVPVTA
jgi:hypothetical protein